MNIQKKSELILIGKSISIKGDSIHEIIYSEFKTKFYADLFNENFLKNLFPYSIDKKGYAAVVPQDNGIKYYAGVIAEATIDGYESLIIPQQTYHVSKASKDKSRLLFDKLENSYFINKETNDTIYNGGIILEVLTNGNPMDAEVELWIPINDL